jgi:hypothetical protein
VALLAQVFRQKFGGGLVVFGNQNACHGKTLRLVLCLSGASSLPVLQLIWWFLFCGRFSSAPEVINPVKHFMGNKARKIYEKMVNF